MLPSKHFPFVISIAGVPLTELMTRDIEEVVVNTSLHMPGMFTIRMRDEDVAGLQIPVTFKYIDNPMFTIGAPVSIRAIPAEESTLPDLPRPLITGEITGLEADFGDGRAVLIIRGYDKSHRLHRGRKTATYLFMSDNLIVQKVTAAAGVPCTAMPTTSPPREYVLQNNQTDMEFLQDIAKRNGYELVVNGLGVLMFKPRGTPLPGPPGPTLTLGDDLLDFRPRMSAARQDAQVMVQGWDAKLKMPISGPFVPLPGVSGGATSKLQHVASKTIFGVSKDIISDVPIATVPEAIAIAKARALDIASQFMQAEGSCRGHPGVQAGTIVTVVGAGMMYSGAYLISSATHAYSASSGYITHFSVTGSQPDTLNDLLGGKGPETRGRFQGVVIGKVTNNIDPLQLNRVKVSFPYLGSLPPVESNWCRIASPWAGGQMSGFLAIPEINDEVLVAFEHGDPNYPYIVGQLWNNLDRPPKPTAAVVIGGKVAERVIKSRSGHVITLSDMPGKESITIVDKTMQNTVKIDSVKNAISISALGDVTIDCLNFKVKAKATMDLSANATAKITGKAGLDLLSQAKTTLVGNAAVEVKGGMAVDIKTTGGGSISIKGPQINLNNGALEVI